MHLTSRESERIELYQVAEFARRRLSRGARISAPEAIAVVCDELLELAWDGVALEEVVAAAYTVLKPDQLMPGVPSAVPQIQVEALFPQGTALVSVDWPFGGPEDAGPGSYALGNGPIVINADRTGFSINVHNASDRPVFVSSHFPFEHVNGDLEFERSAVAGTRLNIPAGTAVTFDPGETRTVELISITRNDRTGEPS